MGANAIVAIDTLRVDASFATFVGVHAHLAVRAIGMRDLFYLRCILMLSWQIL